MQALVNLFQKMNDGPKGVGRLKGLKRFREHYLGRDKTWEEHYAIYRLILPEARQCERSFDLLSTPTH